MMADGEWFRILSGKDEGRLHMAGWKLDAIKGESSGPRDDGWLAFAHCPVCFAMVLADDRRAYGDLTWAHEQWHARTDHPIPENLIVSSR